MESRENLPSQENSGRFLDRKERYMKTGKAWQRFADHLVGYVLACKFEAR
jgi:hypothetical protein